MDFRRGNGLLERSHAYMNVAPKFPFGNKLGVSTSFVDEMLFI